MPEELTAEEPNQELPPDQTPEESPTTDESGPAEYEPRHRDHFSWQASEYIFYQKNPVWYLAFGLFTLALILILVWMHQWFGLPVVVSMALAVVVYASKAPRILSYDITPTGITIDAKHYPYGDFRSFAVLEDVAWHTIDLEPTKRFMPRLTILFDSQDFEQIVAILGQQLPQEMRTPDWIERLSRYLRF